MATTPIYQSPIRVVSSTTSDKENSPLEVNKLRRLIKTNAEASSRPTKTKTSKTAVMATLKSGLKVKMTSGVVDPEPKKIKKTVAKAEDKAVSKTTANSARAESAEAQPRHKSTAKERKPREKKEAVAQDNACEEKKCTRKKKTVSFRENETQEGAESQAKATSKVRKPREKKEIETKESDHSELKKCPRKRNASESTKEGAAEKTVKKQPTKTSKKKEAAATQEADNDKPKTKGVRKTLAPKNTQEKDENNQKTAKKTAAKQPSRRSTKIDKRSVEKNQTVTKTVTEAEEEPVNAEAADVKSNNQSNVSEDSAKPENSTGTASRSCLAEGNRKSFICKQEIKQEVDDDEQSEPLFESGDNNLNNSLKKMINKIVASLEKDEESFFPNENFNNLKTAVQSNEKGVESPHHHHHNSSKPESSKNDGKSINGSKLKSDTKKKDKGEKNVKLKKMKRNLKTDKKMARALLKMSFEFAGNPKGYKGLNLSSSSCSCSDCASSSSECPSDCSCWDSSSSGDTCKCYECIMRARASDDSSSLSDSAKIDSDASCLCSTEEGSPGSEDDDVPRKCKKVRECEDEPEAKKSKGKIKQDDAKYELKYHSSHKHR